MQRKEAGTEEHEATLFKSPGATLALMMRNDDRKVKIYIIDVSEPLERIRRDFGHIPSARNIPFSKLEFKNLPINWSSKNENNRFVLYCVRNMDRAKVMAKALDDYMKENKARRWTIQVLDASLGQWREEGNALCTCKWANCEVRRN